MPTIYHWEQAASPGWFVDIAEVSNVAGASPARAGAYQGIGAFGTLDMAGNVKEWCWNETVGKRYIRGGAWNEPTYMFTALDARLPWDLSAQNGIRCVRYDVREESGLRAPVTRPIRDFSREKPVSDDVFQLYRSYSLPDRVTDYVWVRPYLGAGANLYRSTLSGATPVAGDSVSDNGLGFQAFGGGEMTFASVPRFALSVDLGYHWSRTPFAGFELGGLAFSVSGHWYVK